MHTFAQKIDMQVPTITHLFTCLKTTYTFVSSAFASTIFHTGSTLSGLVQGHVLKHNLGFNSVRPYSSNSTADKVQLKTREPMHMTAAIEAYRKTGNSEMENTLTRHMIVENAIATKAPVTAQFVNNVLNYDNVCTKEHLEYIAGLSPTTFNYPLLPEELGIAGSVLGMTRGVAIAGIYHFRETVAPYNHGVGQTSNFRNRLVMYKSPTRNGAVIR